MVESVSVLLVSIAAVLTAIDQISIVLTTKKLWRQQQQLLQQLEMQFETYKHRDHRWGRERHGYIICRRTRKNRE